MKICAGTFKKINRRGATCFSRVLTQTALPIGGKDGKKKKKNPHTSKVQKPESDSKALVIQKT